MVRHLLIASALALASTSGEPGAKPASPIGHHLDHLREGDLVLREGRGWRADAVRVASAYAVTHVGLLVADGRGGWSVIHAAPPENGVAGSVRMEPLLHFAAVDQAQAVTFRRMTNDPTMVARMVAIARVEARRRTPFDGDFNLADQRRLYCTELIWWALSRAGRPMSPRLTHVAAGVFGGDYLTPRDLVNAGDFKIVKASIR